mmetsp:Transcript_15941/g.20669  ORF Transcript_15941/g.20669 Transcript_15941/m.20669 type:complete len:99 (-) Transcript_15941:96-392(-)
MWAFGDSAQSARLCSHILLMFSDKGSAATMLPRDIGDEVHVVFGKTDDAGKQKVKNKFLKVRTSMLNALTKLGTSYEHVFISTIQIQTSLVSHHTISS